MLEPVQNCFTFYQSDGKSSAHVYTEQDSFLEDKESPPSQEDSNFAQQSLALPCSQNVKNN